jgi:exonuclease III
MDNLNYCYKMLSWNIRGINNVARQENLKNFIHALQTENEVALTQDVKHVAIYQHYLKHTCTYVPRQYSEF